MKPRPASPVGLIGVGLLGTALAQRLVNGGVGAVGFDLDASRCDALLSLGGEAASSPADVFARCDRVLLSLPSHKEVNALLADHSAALRRGQTIIDTTTGDPSNAEKLAAGLAAGGVAYLDATVSGSSAQVREGTAVMMVGGETAAFEACTDVFALLASASFHTGGPGTGAKMKLVTNLVLGLNRAVLAEGLAFARALSLDPALALAIMQRSPAYSRAMDTKGAKMIQGDFKPEARLSQHLKDVRLIVESGTAAGLPMPLSRTHRDLLEAAEAAGFGALDNSAVIRVLAPRQADAPA
ncbi:MAG TPA: NAD(P)-dependent oxidoreductase [Opitutaceae bacterium]|nr:NAD(P)-dependent oxidoreductase [Opitutaceae bacterium]